MLKNSFRKSKLDCRIDSLQYETIERINGICEIKIVIYIADANQGDEDNPETMN